MDLLQDIWGDSVAYGSGGLGQDRQQTNKYENKTSKKGFLQLAREKVTKTKNKMFMSISDNVSIG